MRQCSKFEYNTHELLMLNDELLMISSSCNLSTICRCRVSANVSTKCGCWIHQNELWSSSFWVLTMFSYKPGMGFISPLINKKQSHDSEMLSIVTFPTRGVIFVAILFAPLYIRDLGFRWSFVALTIISSPRWHEEPVQHLFFLYETFPNLK